MRHLHSMTQLEMLDMGSILKNCATQYFQQLYILVFLSILMEFDMHQWS